MEEIDKLSYKSGERTSNPSQAGNKMEVSRNEILGLMQHR